MGKKIKKDTFPIFKPFADEAEPIFDFASETIKYYNILFELYATTFKWEGLPEEIVRDGGELYLEKVLCSQGQILFFYDKVLKEYLVQTYAGSGLNFYRQPTKFQVTAPNGYSKSFTRDEAVPIYNSPYFTNEINTIHSFAQKLALCDMTSMLNVQTQKLPYIIKCTEGQRLTLVNLFKQINEFQPKVFVDDTFDDNALKVYPLNSPFVAEQVYNLKAKYWQEALKYVGVGTGTVKKERVNLEEQLDSQGESNAMLATRMVSRQMAAEQINKMFGLNISVKVREDLESMRKLKEQGALPENEEGVVENG